MASLKMDRKLLRYRVCALKNFIACFQAAKLGEAEKQRRREKPREMPGARKSEGKSPRGQGYANVIRERAHGN